MKRIIISLIILLAPFSSPFSQMNDTALLQSLVASNSQSLSQGQGDSDSKDGKKNTLKMGSYGIGISRLVGAIIEAKYKNDVMKWPKSVAPFDVVIIPSINKTNKENLIKAEKIYKILKKQNIDVLLDDVDENMSNKFKKHDLIGIPFQIIIGSKSEEGKFEFKELNSQSEILNLDDIKLKLKK